MSGLAAELAALDATAQAELVRRGELTAVDLVAAAIERIEVWNPVLNAVVTPLYDAALDQARRGAAGPFPGVPYLVKDLLLEVAGAPITWGSRYLRGQVSSLDSELVTRLRRAGLVIVGKTNTPEFGLVPTCEPVLFGPTRNPWDPTRSTSGSSGGSAAAVAAGLVPMAHANDLGGSIRFPASATGTFGFKPTRGRNPLGPLHGDLVTGMVTEHAITRSVRDSAALLDATAGPAPGDPYVAPPLERPLATEVGAPPGRLRIAFTPRTPSGRPGHPDCRAALDDAVGLLAALGHDVVEADLPGLTDDVGHAIGTVYRSTAAWMVGTWARRIGREPAADELEPVTRAFQEAGQGVTAADYLGAVTVLQAFSRTVAGFLTDVDAWLTPTMSAPPLPLGQIVSSPGDPLHAARVGGATVEYPAIVANITGGAAMSVPLWWNEDGLPIGVHVLGRYAGDATLIRLAAQLEEARPWAGRTPRVTAAPQVGGRERALSSAG